LVAAPADLVERTVTDPVLRRDGKRGLAARDESGKRVLLDCDDPCCGLLLKRFLQ
jgi:hypothetical protein